MVRATIKHDNKYVSVEFPARHSLCTREVTMKISKWLIVLIGVCLVAACQFKPFHAIRLDKLQLDMTKD